MLLYVTGFQNSLNRNSSIASYKFTIRALTHTIHIHTQKHTRNLQCIPIMCLHGLCFLMVWNIHVSCNLLCATCGIVRHRVAMHVTAMQGTCIGKYLTMPYCKNAMKYVALVTN